MNRVVLAAAVLSVALLVVPASGDPRRSSDERSWCPATFGGRLADGQARARRVLAPPGAHRLRVCLYGAAAREARVERAVVGIARRGLIRQVTRRLNALRYPTRPPYPPGPLDTPPFEIGTTDCPYDDRPPYVVVLSYPSGGPVGIRVQTNSCRVVENRHVKRVAPRTGVGAALVAQLGRLVGPVPRGRP